MVSIVVREEKDFFFGVDGLGRSEEKRKRGLSQQNPPSRPFLSQNPSKAGRLNDAVINFMVGVLNTQSKGECLAMTTHDPGNDFP